MSIEITPLLRPEQVKRILGVSLSQVYALAERKQLRCVRLECPQGPNNKKGRKTSLVRFHPEDVVAFIEEHRGSCK